MKDESKVTVDRGSVLIIFVTFDGNGTKLSLLGRRRGSIKGERYWWYQWGSFVDTKEKNIGKTAGLVWISEWDISGYVSKRQRIS